MKKIASLITITTHAADGDHTVYRVAFGTDYCGTFSPFGGKPSRTYKTEAGAAKAMADWASK